MDQGGEANFEYLSAICHLPANLSVSYQERQQRSITDVSICSFRLSFYVGFLMLSQS